VQSDVDIRKDLFSNIVLGGGMTCMPGFAERLTKEMKHLASHNEHNVIKVTADPKRLFSAFIGGSVFSTVREKVSEWWISKTEYDECGPSIVMRKCF
jgi:actin